MSGKLIFLIFLVCLLLPIAFASCEEYKVRVDDCSKYEDCSCEIKKAGDTCYKEIYEINNYECNCRTIQKQVQDCYEEAYCIRYENKLCCREYEYEDTCVDIYECGEECKQYGFWYDCYKYNPKTYKLELSRCYFDYEVCSPKMCTDVYQCTKTQETCWDCSGCVESGTRQICGTRTVEETICDTCSESVFVDLEPFSCEKQGIVCVSNIKICDKENEITEYSVFNPVSGQGFESTEEIPVNEENNDNILGFLALLLAAPFIALMFIYEFFKDEDKVKQAIEDFKNGFIKGSYGSSNIFETIGDFISGILLYGDIRDLIYYIASKLKLTEQDYDDLFGAFAVFGITTELFDWGADEIASAIRVIWKKLPYATRVKWVNYLGKNTDKIKDFLKLLSKISSEKWESFLTSAGKVINKIPIDKFDDGLKLIIKYFKELPADQLDDALKSAAKIIKKLPNEDIIKLAKSKIVIEFADESAGFLTKSMDVFRYAEDEINLGLDLLKDKGIKNPISIVFKKESPNIAGYYDLFDDKIFLNPDKLKMVPKYELIVHEFMHKAQFTDAILLNGKRAYHKTYRSFLSNNLGYIDDDIFNSMMDVGCSKLALTHEGVDKVKFLKEFKNEYDTLLSQLWNKIFKGENIKDLIDSEILSNLAELKVVASKNGKSDLVEYIDELIKEIKDVEITKEFEKITEVFKKFYESLGWSN